MQSSSKHTTAVHGGRVRVSGQGLTPAIEQSTTYQQGDPTNPPEHTYSRASNPTVAALEARMGAIEDAHACAFSSGMAALTSLAIATLHAGDSIAASPVVYGGTHRLFEDHLSRFGIRTHWLDNDQTTIPEGVRLVLIETPANPTLDVVDIRSSVTAARENGFLLVVDNTFLTGAYQRPLDLGADVTLYSTTKFYDGHNATTGGALVTRDESLSDLFRETRKTLGTIQHPFNAWLTLQGMKTLPHRLEIQSQTASRLATCLSATDGVTAVHHPFLGESGPVARSQQQIGGALVSFEISTGLNGARRFCQELELVTAAENLGSVESLATHPATMTHGSVSSERRSKLGISDGLIRISVGLEDPDDILADVTEAVRRAVQ